MSGRSMRAVYEGLAEALHGAKPLPSDDIGAAELNGWEMAAEAIASKLETLNPGFDKRRFLIAAGRIEP